MSAVSARPSGRANANLAGNYYLPADTPEGQAVWVRMSSREREFADACVAELEAGRIPGPTRLNELMGNPPRNTLGGNYSKIRRAVFEGAGLHQRGDHRWYRP